MATKTCFTSRTMTSVVVARFHGVTVSTLDSESSDPRALRHLPLQKKDWEAQGWRGKISRKARLRLVLFLIRAGREPGATRRPSYVMALLRQPGDLPHLPAAVRAGAGGVRRGYRGERCLLGWLEPTRPGDGQPRGQAMGNLGRYGDEVASYQQALDCRGHAARAAAASAAAAPAKTPL